MPHVEIFDTLILYVKLNQFSNTFNFNTGGRGGGGKFNPASASVSYYPGGEPVKTNWSRPETSNLTLSAYQVWDTHTDDTYPTMHYTPQALPLKRPPWDGSPSLERQQAHNTIGSILLNCTRTLTRALMWRARYRAPPTPPGHESLLAWGQPLWSLRSLASESR